MAKESTQHKLDRVRSPRVHITYDVEIGDAIELKELPFVMGVLGDLTGQPETTARRAQGSQICRDQSRQLRYRPQGHAAAPGLLCSEQTERRSQRWTDWCQPANLRASTTFRRRTWPSRWGRSKSCFDLRTRLSDLRGSLQGNDKLDEAFFEAVSNTESREKLRSELGKTGGEE